MQSAHAIAAFAAMAVICGCGVTSPAEEGALWPGKDVSLDTVSSRAGFEVIAPRVLPAGLKLRKAQVVWVVGTPLDTRLPARTAVRLVYDSERTRGAVSIVEARSLPGLSAYDNLNLAIAEGYFADFQAHGMLGKCYLAHDGVDLSIVAGDEFDSEVDRITEALAPGKAPPRG
jgi:hypothetical protein